ALCWLADWRAGVHLLGAGLHIDVLACTWDVQACRRDIPGLGTDVRAGSSMYTQSLQYFRRTAAIADQQGTLHANNGHCMPRKRDRRVANASCNRAHVISIDEYPLFDESHPLQRTDTVIWLKTSASSNG